MKKYTISILLLVCILLLVNLLSRRFFYRFDLTENKQYTLNKATNDVLSNLDEVVTVKAFFSDGLPADFEKVKRDVKEMLVEYANRSGFMIEYDFAKTENEAALKEEAMTNGVSPLSMQIREKDKLEVKEVVLGMSIESGEQREVIAQLQPGYPLEYLLTTAIATVANKDKPSIGLIQGHGEMGLESFRQVNGGLRVSYQLEPLNLASENTIPARFQTLAWIAPTDSIPPTAFSKMDEFLARGGNLFVAINRVDGNLNTQPAIGNIITTGLENWLANKGITVNADFIVDQNYGGNIGVQVPVQMPIFGTVMQQKNIPFYFIPVIKDFPDHPITVGLEQVAMQFASTLMHTQVNPEVTFTPLAYSSSRSNNLPAPHTFDFNKQWTNNDFTKSQLVAAGLLEGNMGGTTPSKIVVIGDGNFPINDSQNPRSMLPEDNINLMVNAIDWLTNNSGLIALRTRTVSSRPINEIEEGKRWWLKMGNVFLPIILIIFYGFYRSQKQRDIRLRRREEKYT